MRQDSTAPAITEAESVIMEVLWHRSPLPTEAVVAALHGQQRWQEGTIKALLNRLLRKSAVRAERDGRRFLYSPRVSREEWLLTESRACWIAFSQAALHRSPHTSAVTVS
jgi:BlaI family penicillinase repressor